MDGPPVIRAEGLCRSFGPVAALAGVDLEAREGTVLGLLGPNGAGKTTAVRILTTLLPPDAGRAQVAGFDVVEAPAEVRAAIGLAGQYAAVDENLTGRENLELVGRLYHLSRGEARRRAEETLAHFDLLFAADRVTKTYSGGMRRRLDLGGSLVGRPRVLFLDEPTAGLDPRSRLGLWEIIEGLVGDGTTVLLTTQYLEEADRVADQIVVIDEGNVIAHGSAAELKSQVGGEVLDLTVADPTRTVETVGLLSFCCAHDAQVDPETGRITAGIAGGGELLAEVVRRLDDAGVHLADLALRRPTLDDVFLTLTGRPTKDAQTDDVQTGGPRRPEDRVGEDLP